MTWFQTSCKGMGMGMEMEGAEAVLKMEGGSSVGIRYHPDFGTHPDDLILLDLPLHLLPDLLLHHRVSLRGEADEEAVLCTRSKTYALKAVSTSNSVMLIPPSSCRCPDASAPVIKLASHTLELSPVPPRLDKLRLLLLGHTPPYTPHSQPRPFDLHHLYRWDDLVQLVQASDDELRAALLAFPALEIDGYWRVVDDRYMDSMLTFLLHNCVLNDWSFGALVEDKVLGVMASDGFPPDLSLHCLRVFASKADGSGSGSGSGLGTFWSLDERRVCIHFAQQVLRDRKAKMEHFMGEWLRKIPDGMHATFDMLQGQVLTEKIGIETWVRLFSVSSLPSSPADRFSALFKECPRWEWKELEPYIRDLSVPGLSSEGLLLKYTRRTQPTPDSEPVFTAR